ncbi:MULTISPECIES: type I polyketide synthase [unclassified Nocardiopsis]|uniref:type I polyketide synthase n=1 Tax=Nocardiopsis TaxID=2013 RepID=UPI00387AE4FC
MAPSTAEDRPAAAAPEPLAVIGMSCRLPGGINSPRELWRLLESGGDVMGELPPDRWEAYTRDARNAAALRGTTRLGGFLTDPAGFDSEFFGVTPREAELMDPQQRIILELVWEALEHAGVDPHALGGTDTGVFMGVGSDDYGRQLLEDLPGIEAWSGIGAAMCAVANRVSYLLDLRGPSFTLDAACASSLVAVNSAAQSLRSGECSTALVGGINVIAGPGLTMVLDEAQAVSPRGRSRPFDADADGYGRSEGAGVIVLKRLSEALNAGDRVLGLIRGSAVNQDGRTQGIMAPNGEAQRHVIRNALANAGVEAATVGYVEAHGTGTRAGDPIEASALAQVYGASRDPEDPCLIGSVKGAIGHLEAGAGIAGIIKALLVLENRRIPPQAGFSTPNPAIPWETSGLRVPDRAVEWPRADLPRRVGVSAFGYGGTVGHAVLEEAPPAEVPSDTAEAGGEGPHGAAPQVYPLSAATASGLRTAAADLAEAVTEETSLPDLRHTLWRRRAHLPERAAIVAADRTSLRYGLGLLAAGKPSPDVLLGRAGEPQDPVWVFSGHGAQWEGMGAQLLAEEPAFAKVVDTVDPVFREGLGYSPREAIAARDLGGVDRIQSLLFVMHLGLAEVWYERGLRPAAVIGHSVGEIAAAVVAGVLDVTEGAVLSCRRSALLRRVAGAGAMAMVQIPFEEVSAELGPDGPVTAAIELSPHSTVVAGTPEAVAEYTQACKEKDVLVLKVQSDVAFHSTQMDPLLPEMLRSVDGAVPRPPRIPLYSTALADPRSADERSGTYWAANLRNPVRFANAVRAAVEDGHTRFLEVSAHTVVSHALRETLADAGLEDGVVVGSLRRKREELPALASGLGALYCAGSVDPAGQSPDGVLLDLPRRRWEHQRYWREARPGGSGGGHDVGSHTLLGAAVGHSDPAAPRVWWTHVEHGTRPYPGEHEVRGHEIVPAAVTAATFLAAAGSDGLCAVRFRSPLRLDGEREVQVVANGSALRLLSRRTGGGDAGTAPAWELHAEAKAAPDVPDLPPEEWADPRAGCDRGLDPASVLERLRAGGIAAAGLPWTVEELSGGDGVLFARIGVGTDDPATARARLLDAVTTAAPLLLGEDTELRLLSGIGSVHLSCVPATSLVRIHEEDGLLHALVTDGSHRPVGRVEGLELSTLEEGGGPVDPRRLTHRLDWVPRPDGGAGRALRSLVVVGGDDAARRVLREHAEAQGVRCLLSAGPEDLDALDPDGSDAVVVLGEDGGYGRTPETALDAVHGNCWRLARTAQVLARRSPGRSPLLWCVTTGVRSAADPASPAQSALWGLGQIVAGEHPELWGGVVDLDVLDAASADGLLAVLRGPAGAEITSVRGTAVQAARIVPVEDGPEGPPLRCRPDASYLVTGGLGVLGLKISEWLVERGARRLVLAGRTGLPPRRSWDTETDPLARSRIDAVRALEAAGATVRAVAVDVADPRALAATLSPDALDMPPVRGVVHAAGVLDDRLLGRLDSDSLRTVLRPKVAGARSLELVAPPGGWDFTVHFSSVGQFLGLPGQAGYAAANAYLDGAARHDAASGGTRTLSLSWTSWRRLGMAENSVVEMELRDRGIGTLTGEEAFGAWDRAHRRGEPHVCVFPTVARESAGAPLPVLENLEFGEAHVDDPPEEISFGSLTPEELTARVREEVARQVSEEIRRPVEDMEPHTSFSSMGLDSVITLSLRRRLDRRFRLSLPASLVWDRPSVAGVADYIAERLREEA